MENRDIKGTLSISFDTDDDFGFDNLDEIREGGWEIRESDGGYIFKLNYAGDADDLGYIICEDLFENVRTSKTYIMKKLCDAFDKLINNCNYEKMEENVYIGMGNQTIDADFEFDSANELENLKLRLERVKENMNYHKELLKQHELRVSEFEKEKSDIEKQISEIEASNE